MDFLLSCIVGLSVGTWLYVKIFRPRFMDMQTPIIASAAVGVLLTLMVFSITRIIF